ncbi:MAG: hypothetical protein PHF86_09035 [Candidatus Nanoarchaeia archaeon]|nr:hypothetical protein [Candidatus Nanoarchaeia archaeon]
MIDIFIYRITSSFRDHKLRDFLIENEDSGEIVTTPDIFYLAQHIYDEQDRLNFEGDRTNLHTYLDGYFGRPLVPCDSYLLRKLYKKERANLEQELDKLRHKR